MAGLELSQMPICFPLKSLFRRWGRGNGLSKYLRLVAPVSRKEVLKHMRRVTCARPAQRPVPPAPLA